ncbi:penicillin-binding transpeptidase domain-containing protein [Pontibacter sp. G13]|uniref:penicillin-binding transpeptidase domain-containing protein n=1 Tax=Pontibacter sp. G13 TaxID=3074898 RepID=UPI002888FE15|nr:penicillin-binding transpeptidase domain-containing protein [Pontibacter sp. G13]WNJ16712.1 penicillin-binding transpeptidase domain-containing protein [Pontibacter sp. G13]
MIRLLNIQVLSDEYERKAEQNVVKLQEIVPPRGNLYNRYGDIYVSSRPMFNMYISKNKLHIPDTAVLRNLLGLTQAEIEEKIANAHSYKETEFARYIDPETYGALQEKMWSFRGITFTNTNKRYYRSPVGAHILGHIKEVSQKEIEQSDHAYKSGDLIGSSGIERSHDSTLRGKQGIKRIIKDVHQRIVGSYAGGKYDVDPIRGKDIMLGIDTDLQAFGEHIMQNKRGSIVAIEPSSGEILAFVSAPSYNPSMLTGRDLRNNYRELKRDTLKPLLNRPLSARYPPGSIFKLPVALAALNEDIITDHTIYHCGGGFGRNRGKPGCRFHVTPLALDNAIRYSCNAYFAATYWDFLHSPKFSDIYEAYDRWYKYMNELGVGVKTSVDIPYEPMVKLPSHELYDKIYGQNRWQASTIISLSIGQGEILMTPLQMANMVTIIANRGKYIPPHFVRATREKPDDLLNSGQPRDPWIKVPYDTTYTSIAGEHYESVIDAMELVVANGTARRAFIPEADVVGKTGTVQNPHGEDHAVFVGFAPKDNPRIAIAVVIENAGGGGSWAAPTASLMIEHYLRGGEIEAKKWELERILNANFID